MRVKAVLTFTAIVSSILGATVVYLLFSVPNDLRADAMLRLAHQQVEAGKTRDARVSLSRVIQQYPRTDAAAAATVALVTLEQKDREELQRAVLSMSRQNEQLAALFYDLRKTVNEVKNAPPKVVTVQAPAPAPKPKPKPAPTKKKTPPKKKR